MTIEILALELLAAEHKRSTDAPNSQMEYAKAMEDFLSAVMASFKGYMALHPEIPQKETIAYLNTDATGKVKRLDEKVSTDNLAVVIVLTSPEGYESHPKKMYDLAPEFSEFREGKPVRIDVRTCLPQPLESHPFYAAAVERGEMSKTPVWN